MPTQVRGMTSARPRTAPAEIALRRAPMRPRTAPAPSLRLRQKQACGPTVLHEFLQIAQVLVSAPYLTLRYPRDSVGPEGTAYKNSCSPEVAPRGRSATCPFSRRISTVLTRNKYRSHEQQVPFSRGTSTVLTANKYRSHDKQVPFSREVGQGRGRRPRSMRSARRWPAPVKWWVRSPTARAPLILAGESSTKRVKAAMRP